MANNLFPWKCSGLFDHYTELLVMKVHNGLTDLAFAMWKMAQVIVTDISFIIVDPALHTHVEEK